MTSNQTVSVSCTSLSPTLLAKAGRKAKKLGLNFCEISQCKSPYILTFTDQRLELRVNPLYPGSPGFSPLFVDFVHGPTNYRYLHNRTIHQPIAKAVGIKPGFRPTIFDATAGLGTDGFVFASLGCLVTLSERSPVLGALLEDGLRRAEENSSNVKEIFEKRIELILGDSQTTLRSLKIPPHTVYLDPMYPHTSKSALNKKEMRIIRDVVGGDDDSPALFQTAIEVTGNRVVVKRPKGAPFLAEQNPTHSISMKNSRFDIYLIRKSMQDNLLVP